MHHTQKIILFTSIIIFSATGFACSSNLTAEAPAEITRVRVVLDRDTKTKKKKTSSNRTKKTTKTTYETEIDYRYTVGGRTYEGYTEKDGDVQRDFAVGTQAKVCYNPQNPSESDVFPIGYRCGS
jgi:hypothetical protein